MSKGRKNGFPVNIKNWLVYILDISQVTPAYVRIYGLNSLTRTVEGETEDGSADTDTWGEPYITKRNGKISLEGKEVVTESTGELDAGQEILNFYADMSGFDADATLKFIDPYGHAWIADYIITSREVSADNSGTTLSWDLEQVGEVEVQPYVQVSSVAFKDSENTTITTLALETDDTPEVITVSFTPATSSNQRFKITNSRRSIVTVSNVTETGFTVTPVGVGTANIVVTTVNGAKTATLAVTVTAAST